MIKMSLTRYESKTSKHNELIKLINQKTTNLDDLHQMLIIITTLSVIEKYQDENLPGTKQMEGYLKELNNTINTENQLIEKNIKK